MKSTLIYAAAAFTLTSATFSEISSTTFVGEGKQIFGSTYSIGQVKHTSVISAGTGGNVVVEAVFPSQNPVTKDLSLVMTHGATEIFDHYQKGIFSFACQGAAGVQAHVRNPPSIRTSGHYQMPAGQECRSIFLSYAMMSGIRQAILYMGGTHFSCIQWSSLSQPIFQGDVFLNGRVAQKVVSLHLDYSFVSCGTDGLVVISHSDVSNPTIVSELGPSQGLNCDFRDIIVKDDRLIIANGAHGIRIYDITNPSTPVLVGDYAGFHHAPITSVLVPARPNDISNYRLVAAAPGDRLYIMDYNTLAIIEDDVQFSDVEKLASNNAQTNSNFPSHNGRLRFSAIGGNTFKNILWDNTVIVPPVPAGCDPVKVSGVVVSGQVAGKTMPLNGGVTLEEIPNFLVGSELYAPTLPVASSTDIVLECCGSSTCEFFITVFRCAHCPSSTSDLPGILLSGLWEAGSCSPKFSVNSGTELFGMVSFHKQLQPGEVLPLPPTALDTRFMAIFKLDSVTQPWCPAAGTSFVGAQPPCTCPQ